MIEQIPVCRSRFAQHDIKIHGFIPIYIMGVCWSPDMIKYLNLVGHTDEVQSPILTYFMVVLGFVCVNGGLGGFELLLWVCHFSAQKLHKL